MREGDSFSLFSSVKVVRELLQRRLEEGGGGAQGELEAAVQEIEALWEELRRQASELALERQRYGEFFEYAPDAYLVSDPYGTLQQANRAAAELLQVGAAGLQGKPLLAFVPEADRAAFRTQLVRASAQPDGEASEWHAAVQPRGQAPFKVHVRVRALPAPGGGLAPLCWLLRRAP